MNQDTAIELVVQCMTIAMKVAGPILIVGLVVGLVISVIQAVTQIQEQTLSFIPKVAAMAGVLVVLGPWMLNQLLTWITELYTSIPQYVG